MHSKRRRHLLLRGLSAQTRVLLTGRSGTRDKLGQRKPRADPLIASLASTWHWPPQIPAPQKSHRVPLLPQSFAAGDPSTAEIVSWDTDEPATSQVEFNQGSGRRLLTKSQFDGNLTTNHTVAFVWPLPSQVYHLRVLS